MERLLQVLQQRDLQSNGKIVQQVLGSQDSHEQLSAWADEYISNDTVLTRDELKLWRWLKQQRQLELGAQKQPVSDADLQSAIESLHSSTAAIEKQTKVLDAQRVALQALRRSNEIEASLRNEKHNHSPADADRLNVTVEALEQGLTEDFTAIGDHLASTVRSVASYASERLGADDTSLDSITKLKLNGSSSTSGPDAKTVDRWCQSLIKFRAATVKAQIDEVYNSVLDQGIVGADVDINHTDSEERQALQAELDSLKGEIDSITNMVVDHQLRKPITASIESSEAERKQSQQEWLNYISSSLQYIAARANTLGHHASELHGFQAALTEIKGAFATQPVSSSPELASPPKLERNMSGLRPLLLTRSVSGTIDTDDPVRLLRTLDADIDVGKDGMSTSQLREMLRSKQVKAESQKLAAESSNLQVLGEFLGHENAEVRTVMSALHAHTAFNTKTPNNPSSDEKLARLDHAIALAGQGISAFESRQSDPLPQSAQRLVKKYG